MPANDKNSKKNGGMTREKAREFFEANQIKFVLAQFVDIHGVAKTKAVPVEHFEDVILEDGAGFAGFALWGMGQAPHDPDYLAIGDLATLTLVPWQPGYARIVCAADQGLPDCHLTKIGRACDGLSNHRRSEGPADASAPVGGRLRHQGERA